MPKMQLSPNSAKLLPMRLQTTFSSTSYRSASRAAVPNIQNLRTDKQHLQSVYVVLKHLFNRPTLNSLAHLSCPLSSVGLWPNFEVWICNSLVTSTTTRLFTWTPQECTVQGVGGWVQPPPPPSAAECLEAPKAPKKIFGLNSWAPKAPETIFDRPKARKKIWPNLFGGGIPPRPPAVLRC